MSIQCPDSVSTVTTKYPHSVLTFSSECSHNVHPKNILTAFYTMSLHCLNSVHTGSSQKPYMQCLFRVASVLTVSAQPPRSALTVFPVFAVFWQSPYSVLSVSLQSPQCPLSVFTMSLQCAITSVIMVSPQCSHDVIGPRFEHQLRTV